MTWSAEGKKKEHTREAGLCTPYLLEWRKKGSTKKLKWKKLKRFHK